MIFANRKNGRVALQRMDNVGIVVESLDAARLRRHGAQLVAEVIQYEDVYRLCYVRGPEGILIGLAEQIG
jgi:hypothetical protein